MQPLSNDRRYVDTIYEKRMDEVVYNFTETVSTNGAPVFYQCGQGMLDYILGMRAYLRTFGDINTIILSALQNFLGKVFTINTLYSRFTEALTYNDVDMQWFYLGEMLYYMTNFPVVVMDDTQDPNYSWETDPAFNGVSGNTPAVMASLEKFN
jgi:hypothetical protein